MTLLEELDDTYHRLTRYEKTHPNLVQAWKRRLCDDVIAVYKSIHAANVAVDMFRKYPDMSVNMMSLIHAFFRVCRPAAQKNPDPDSDPDPDDAHVQEYP